MIPGLETIDTQDLIDELRGRSEVFFCCFRPKVKKDYAWQWSVGGDEDKACGLAKRAMIDILKEDD